MSYSLLLYQGAPTRPRLRPSIDENENQPPPPPPGEKTASIVKSCLCLINAVSRLDLPALQVRLCCISRPELVIHKIIIDRVQLN